MSNRILDTRIFQQGDCCRVRNETRHTVARANYESLYSRRQNWSRRISQIYRRRRRVFRHSVFLTRSHLAVSKNEFVPHSPRSSAAVPVFGSDIRSPKSFLSRDRFGFLALAVESFAPPGDWRLEFLHVRFIARVPDRGVCVYDKRMPRYALSIRN